MNYDRVLGNTTWCTARTFPLVDHTGREIVVVIAKMTYRVSANGTVSLTANPIRLVAEPTSPDRIAPHARRAPETHGLSLHFPSDVCDTKPGTDVLMVGTAYPLTATDSRSVDVSLRVAARPEPIAKTVRVHGPRVWQRTLTGGVGPGPAGALTPTPLVYELAFGGAADPRNPVGSGFLDGDRTALVGQPAPQLENPAASVESSKPVPAAFAALPAHWEPRARFFGTVDDGWRRTRAPVRPVDFDPRFHATAPPDQWRAVPLEGDEPVEITNATPEHRWAFQLPRYRPRFFAWLRDRRSELETHLDTFLIDADRRRVELVWRAAVGLPKIRRHLSALLVASDDEENLAGIRR